jgi:hypothetical protein
MTYGEIQAAYGQLRKRLTIYAGAEALPDITLDAPKGSSDELSFIRLVSWAYVALYETGRVPLGFLRQLPPWNEPSGALLPHVRALRTWTSHNLSLEKEVDVATLRRAVEWFSKTCGVGTPSKTIHWQTCFEKLCAELLAMLGNAIAACDAFEDVLDRQRLLDELKTRLDRNWPAFRFDTYAVAAATKFSYAGIDIVKFRSDRLNAWRNVVATSAATDIERNLNLRIESDLLSLMGFAMPITSEEFSTLLNPIEPAALISVLLTLKAADQLSMVEIVTQLKARSGSSPDDGV